MAFRAKLNKTLNINKKNVGLSFLFNIPSISITKI